jgi:hypothetical protein
MTEIHRPNFVSEINHKKNNMQTPFQYLEALKTISQENLYEIQNTANALAYHISIHCEPELFKFLEALDNAKLIPFEMMQDLYSPEESVILTQADRQAKIKQMVKKFSKRYEDNLMQSTTKRTSSE